MLVTDPRQRASLAEIMNHPWMTKGFSGPPENYLPHREPLSLPLDMAVVHKMTGFDFGSPEYITDRLTKILQSDSYQRAVRHSAQKHSQVPDLDRSRGILNFYKRRNSATSRDTLFNPSSDAIPLGEDPVNAFAPLLSVYYLVREKMERDKRTDNPGALSIPSTSGEKPLIVADLPAPPAAHTNSASYEMKGETTGGRTRPRARTRGEDEIASQAEKKPTVPEQQPHPSNQAEITPRRESTAGAILRRISTRRRRPDPPSTEHRPMPPSVAVTSPSDAGPVGSIRKSFSTRRPRLEDPPSSASLNTASKPPPELLTPPANESSFPRRFMSLRRAASVDRRRLARRNASESHQEPPVTSGSDGSSSKQRIPDMPSEHPIDASNRLALRTKSLGHARKESIQKRRALREGGREQDVKEEPENELLPSRTEPVTDHEGGEESIKPVYLKGLFSVSTTSSKPLPYIRNDIIRVLHQLGVQYTDVKGGFRCRHAASLKDLTDLGSPLSPSLLADKSHSHRRKVSFNNNNDPALRSPNPRTRPRNQDGSPAISDTDSENAEQGRAPTARDAGATSTHVRDEMTRNMTVDFEIFIVKVPLLSLHGIQFKKVDGNIMQYKTLAQEILKGLKL